MPVHRSICKKKKSEKKKKNCPKLQPSVEMFIRCDFRLQFPPPPLCCFISCANIHYRSMIVCAAATSASTHTHTHILPYTLIESFKSQQGPHTAPHLHKNQKEKRPNSHLPNFMKRFFFPHWQTRQSQMPPQSGPASSSHRLGLHVRRHDVTWRRRRPMIPSIHRASLDAISSTVLGRLKQFCLNLMMSALLLLHDNKKQHRH